MSESIRDEIAAVLKDIFPLYEAGKFGSDAGSYGWLAGELGLARTMSLGEYCEELAKVLPTESPRTVPADEAVKRGKLDILKRASAYASDSRLGARLTAAASGEDPAKSAYHRGRSDAFGTMQAYLSGMAEETP